MNSKVKFKIFSTFCIPNKITAIYTPFIENIAFKMSKSLITERSKLLEEIRNCNALICTPYDKIDKELLENAQNLKLVSCFSIGYEHLDLVECFKRNIRITTTPYFDSGALAEFAIGIMINLSRNITIAANETKGLDWKSLRKDLYWYSGNSLKDSVIGIVGLGNIGMGIAKRLKSFDVKKILYYNRNLREDAQKLGYEHTGFDDLLKQSDFVVCSCSINEQSKGIFNKSAFDKMKSSSVFVNISRGLAVNQDDLYEALKNGKIKAAGLDVTSPQPLQHDHKLYTLKNCLITPHLAWSDTKTTDERVLISLKNVLNFYQGQELISEIKKSDDWILKA